MPGGKQILKVQHWDIGAKLLPEDRTCGTCYACCVHLGITELRKYGGQTCKHLDGSNPCGRCSIYASRPSACSQFYCLWRVGILPKDGFAPEECGMLVTHFVEDDGKTQSATVTIFDNKKADGKLMEVISELIMSGMFHCVAVIRRDTMSALLFQDGKMWKAKLLRNAPGEYENSTFLAEGEPMANFVVEHVSREEADRREREQS